LITTLVDNTTDIFDKNFLELNMDESNLELLKNDAFKNALFYESLKRETVDNYCYLYLLITCNFFSKYNFISYENSKSLEALLKEYLNFKLQSSENNPGTISNLDKLLLQISSPKFNNVMEIDHIFPLNGVKISHQSDKHLNLNNIGNLCYLSKRNNQKKYNKLPNDYINNLNLQNEPELLQEFLTQSFGNHLQLKTLFGQINSVSSFNNFLIIRSRILITNILKGFSKC
jgi:hypothetical protein